MKLSLALLLSLHCVFVQASHRTDLATWEACIREPRQLDCNTTTSCSAAIPFVPLHKGYVKVDR